MPQHAPTHSEQQGRSKSDQAYAQQHRWLEERQVYHSARWQRMRLLVLRVQPLCADPYGWHAESGRYEAATQVDHIVPLRVDRTLAFVRENLQGLCARCHSAKTHRQRGERRT